MKIGFIGLGIMGAPMAVNLPNAGHEMFVRTRSMVPDALVKATACKTNADVARAADVIVLMLPDTPDVESVLFGEGGVAEGLSSGKVVMDMSSVSPIETKAFARKVNALGCEYLDAPVSGGEVGAKAASLTIMCGGSEEGEAPAGGHGQEHQPGGWQWRRTDHEGCQPDHRGLQYRRGR